MSQVTFDSIKAGSRTSVDSSAIVDIVSVSKGFLLPRMTQAQRLAIVSPASGLEVYDTTNSAPYFFNGITWVSNSGSGSVVSVGLADGSSSPIYSISGSPVTGSGTLTFSLVNQNSNKVFAGPVSGSNAQPSFRSLVLADMPTGLGTVTSVGLTSPGVLYSVSGSPVTGSGTLALNLISQSANRILAGPVSGSSAAPSFRSLVSSDIPSLSYVTSVGLSAPAIFTVSGSPVTGSGTLSFALANQNQNLFFASPSGSSGSPTFRSIVSSDLPTGTGTVTSVSMTTPGVIFNSSVSGSPITGSGTLALTLISQSANNVLAGPVSGGSASPSFRSLVSSDIPALSYVTSVGLALPNIFSVSGSPVTGSGTLTGALVTQSPNLVWAGPVSGSAATPTFRSLVSTDIPTLAYVDLTSNQTIGGIKSLTGNTNIAQATASIATIGVTGSTARHVINGGIRYTTRTVTGNFTIDNPTTDYIIYCNHSASITGTFPSPSSGAFIIIKDISGAASTNPIIMARASSENIEGVSGTKTLQTNWGSWNFSTDLTNWFMV